MHYFQLLYILFLFSLGISLVKSYVFVDVKKYIFSLHMCCTSTCKKSDQIYTTYMNNTWKTSLQYYLIFYLIFDIEGFLFNKLTKLNIKKINTKESNKCSTLILQGLMSYKKFSYTQTQRYFTAISWSLLYYLKQCFPFPGVLIIDFLFPFQKCFLFNNFHVVQIHKETQEHAWWI